MPVPQETRSTRPGGHVVVVGASAGGVEALRKMVAGFPADLDAAVVVVLHIPRSSPGALPSILGRAGPLPAQAARHHAPLRRGVVHVAPPDHHVLIEDGRLLLSTGPTENGHRPAIDPLFRSAAVSHGPRAIGVVLSGTRDDGAAGLAVLAEQGGIAIVQDLDDALYAAMPANALQLVPDALVRTAEELGAAVAELVRRPVGPRPPSHASVTPLRAEVSVAVTDRPSTEDISGAVPSPYSCPHCHGVLFEVPGPPRPRFRCRVGHAWSPGSLEADQATGVENALWIALRALEEKASLVRRLADEAHANGHRRTAEQYRAGARHAEEQAEQVRALLQPEQPSTGELSSG